MKRTIILFSIATTIGALASCKSTQMKGLVYHLDQQKTTTKANAKVNDTLTFKMEGNPSTGYSWSSNINQYEGDFKIVTDAYEEDDNKPEDIIGAPSIQVYQYVPLKAGTYTIHFEYKRGWEKNTPPLKQKTVILKVD